MNNNIKDDSVVMESTAAIKAASKPTKADLEKQINDQNAAFAALKAQYDELLKAKSSASASSPSGDVSLVYLSDSLGVVIGSNCTLNCTKYGEEFVLSRTQFDEIVGKYRSWFDKGILAVSYKNTDVAAAKGLLTDKEYNLSAAKLESIGKMSVKELQQLWDETPLDDQRLSITTYFKRKYMEGLDPAFRDREKVDLLNRLTNGGFQREAQELGGFDLKIRPTEF